ncbi:MAG: flagellar assembly protein FliH [Phycisphaerales bacterium]
MALIPHAQLDEVVREAVAIDFGDLSRRAEHLRREAQAHAQRVLEHAAVERMKLVEGGREQGHADGFAAGQAEGLEEGRASGRAEVLAQLGPQIESLLVAWGEALGQFEDARDTMLSEARQDVVRLALTLAEKVTHRMVEVDHTIVGDQLEQVLGLLTRPTRLRVLVHPDDEPAVRDAMPTLLDRFENATHAEITHDPALLRGSVIARSDTGGVLDASITTQLDRLVLEILPGGLGPNATEGTVADPDGGAS